MIEPLAWTGFILLVLTLLFVDLRVVNRKAHPISYREAAFWSAVWISLAISFGLLIYFWRGSDDALDFFAGYVLEKSLSLDNIVVFVVILSSAGVEARYQHKVLFWGILGALVTRGSFIIAGVELIAHFHWFLYILGFFLVTAGARLMRKDGGKKDPTRSRIMNLARRLFPVTANYEEGKFFVWREGRLFATPLLLVLLTIEITDVLFAVDSIPAVFSVTQDPFIVYTSNILAILGLRALYFLLADAVTKFRYLRPGLSAMLLFVGGRLLLARLVRIQAKWVLAVILLTVVVAIIASILKGENAGARAG